MTAPALIGIHGLRNKPPHTILRDWWQRSIAEGLERNLRRAGVQVKLDLAYWADVMHPEAVPVAADTEPYFVATGTGPFPAHRGSLSQVAGWVGKEAAGKALDKLSAAPLVDRAVEKKLASSDGRDLAVYYEDPAQAEKVRERLAKALAPHARDGQPVVLVAHSMGTIVAYDTLRDMEASGLRVVHLITLGCPLGFDLVKRHAAARRRPLAVPDNVQQWTNLADRRDRACWDSALATDYRPNRGEVTVNDCLVSNEYQSPAGEPNPHKIYGYLRTPEFSLLIDKYL